MKCWIGFGSNLGDRLGNLERAARELGVERVSPVIENPALVLPGAPMEWRKPFLNAVGMVDWAGTPLELLARLKSIEAEMGRVTSERWAPRVIDLDILTFGDEKLESEKLNIPHKAMWERSFVLDPLKHLDSDFALKRSRELRGSNPLWMGIINLTPDSFSDGHSFDAIPGLIEKFEKENVQMLDFGGQSTRPGATTLTAKEEWLRIEPALKRVSERYRGRLFKPLISVDTFYPEVASLALELGVDMINDVSGFARPGMLEVIEASECQYILMHSLSVPADSNLCLKTEDPVREVKAWAIQKLEDLSRAGISMNRVMFDPGVGFGKTAAQSFEMLQRIDEFLELPCRLIVGHSRKSFFDFWAKRPAPERDPETLGASMRLAERGVDVLRVHAPDIHARAFRAFQEIQSC